jgi:hypothetical protein
MLRSQTMMAMTGLGRTFSRLPLAMVEVSEVTSRPSRGCSQGAARWLEVETSVVQVEADWDEVQRFAVAASAKAAQTGLSLLDRQLPCSGTPVRLPEAALARPGHRNCPLPVGNYTGGKQARTRYNPGGGPLALPVVSPSPSSNVPDKLSLSLSLEIPQSF